MNPYLQLLRIPQLLFVGLTLLLMRRAVVMPVLQVYGFEPVPLGVSFCLLIVATLCVAAGGCVLCDYFDIKADTINRPDQLVITRRIDKTGAMRFYQVLTAVGILCGLLSAWLSKSLTLAFIFIVTPGLLWFYASNYKRQFLMGNIVVAFCSMLALLAVPIGELGLLKSSYGELLYTTPIPKIIYGSVGGFAAVAFVLTWVLSLLRDMENEPGDREMEYRTLPVKWGLRNGKVFFCCLVAVACIVFYIIAHKHVASVGTLPLRYAAFGLILPLVIAAVMTIRAGQPSDYRLAAAPVWFAMSAGAFYSFVFYYLQAKAHGIIFFGLFTVQ